MVDAISSQGVQDVMGIFGTEGGSVQMRLAALQMAMAQISKDKAMDYMGQIEKAQAESKAVSDMISKARALQASAGEEGVSEMPPEMVQFFKDRGLAFDTTSNDNYHNKKEWDFNVTSLTNYQQTVGSNTQQLMVFIQDFMGQYNSYLTGSNTAIQQSNQTLATIARGQ
jgi:hypothetical protein